jgi:transmembrane 9 superfamily protein 2/4
LNKVLSSKLTPRSLFAILDFLVGGAIGFIAVFFAVRTLYGSIRVD